MADYCKLLPLCIRPSRLVLRPNRLVVFVSRLTFLDLLLFFCFKQSSSPTQLNLLGPSSPVENKAKS